jgi:hypothetical protein
MEPMPRTMVQKITGAIIILMSLIKPSPSGLRDFANLREHQADDGAQDHGDE